MALKKKIQVFWSSNLTPEMFELIDISPVFHNLTMNYLTENSEKIKHKEEKCENYQNP